MEDELQFFRKEQLTDNILPSSPPGKKICIRLGHLFNTYGKLHPLTLQWKDGKEDKKKKKEIFIGL